MFPHMHLPVRRRRALAVAIAPVLALLAAACGGGQSASSQPATNGAQTVSVRTVPGAGAVLVDAHGAALYSPVQEAHGMVRCTGACVSIWRPLTVPSGSRPSTAASLAGNLGTIRRPGGATQVTYRGAPLYSFALDHKAGVATGNGVHDAFSGERFTWKVASVSGSASAPTTAPATRGY